MSVTDEQILERLRVLLGESDLQTTTEKMLRKKLEDEFKMDMTEKKPLLRQEIERYLEEQGGEEESEEEEEEEEEKGKPRRGGGLTAVCWLSEPMQQFLGEEEMPRTQVVKRIWEYIKANNLQNPKDKRNIILDDKLRTIFTSPLTMFSLNVQLGKHVKRLEREPEPKKRAASKGSAGNDTAAKPKAKKAKVADGGEEGGEEGGSAKKPSNFNKPVRLSAVAAAWCGKEAMGRSDLTSFFWKYVKEKELQDPKDKRFVLCDEHLKKVTDEERISGFSFSKYIAKHILKD